MAKTIITVTNISKSYGKIRALCDFSFSVESGSCFGFLGPNGAGKTTAMKIIYGKCTRDKDHDSEMDIFGYDPATNELAIKYLSGVVQQENNLDDELNVKQNLKTLRDNKRAQRCFSKCGFTTCGHQVEKGHNFVLMELTRTRYQERTVPVASGQRYQADRQK